MRYQRIFKSNTAAAVSSVSDFNWHCQYAVANIQMWHGRTYFNIDKGHRLLPGTTRRMLDAPKTKAYPEPLIVYKYSADWHRQKKFLGLIKLYNLKYFLNFTKKALLWLKNYQITKPKIMLLKIFLNT